MASTTADPPPDPLDRLHGEVLDHTRRLRAVQVRLARTLLALRRAPSLYRFGATTFALYCETVGLSPSEGRDLASLAEAALVRPDLAARFAEGRLNLGKVAALASLLRLPPSGFEDRDWVRVAEGVTTRDLWRLLEEGREARRLRDPPEFVAMFVSRRGREDFHRCRDLVSRREWLPVTEGATLERVCDAYLLRHDPERRAVRLEGRDRRTVPGTRHGAGTRSLSDESPAPMPPVAGPAARRRRVPPAMQRALLRLFGDRCWVEGCDRRRYLAFAHRVPARLGGGEDEDNLLRLCGEHHAQFDGEGWRPIPRRDGAVVLVDRRGIVVGRLRSVPRRDGAGAERLGA